MAEQKNEKVKKSNTTSWVAGIVIIVLVAIGLYYYVYAPSVVAPVVAPSVFSGNVENLRMLEFTYLPPTLTVSVGTMVNWTNGDKVPSDVVSNDGLFNSGSMDTGASYSYVFESAGTYEYHSSLHPTMKGKIIVQ
jgi:plastocyanin